MESKALYEARQHHMNVVTSSTSTDLRSWKHKLETAIHKCNTGLFTFLQSKEGDPSIHYKEFIETLADGKLLAGSVWLAKNIQHIDTEKLDLGFDLEKFQETKKQLMDKYLECVETLFSYDARICKTLEKLYDLEHKLIQVIDVDDASKESSELQTSILHYIEAKYAGLDLENDYKKFCSAYARFIALRDTLSGVMPVFPTCSICTSEKIGCVLVPCGHAFCSECAARQRAQCFVCRCTVNARQQIYF